MVVYFTLILANKRTSPWATASEISRENRRDGFCRADVIPQKCWNTCFEKFEKIPWKKSILIILGNRTLHDGYFFGNFLKYFRTAILKSTAGRLSLEDFLSYGSSYQEVLKELL